MSRLRKQICVLLLVSITPSKAVSQLSGNSVTVSGVVLAEGNNQAIEHVAVHLCDGGGNLLEQTTTLQTGEFYFRGMRRGRYILTFEANGYLKTRLSALDLSYASDKGMTALHEAHCEAIRRRPPRGWFPLTSYPCTTSRAGTGHVREKETVRG